MAALGHYSGCRIDDIRSFYSSRWFCGLKPFKKAIAGLPIWSCNDMSMCTIVTAQGDQISIHALLAHAVAVIKLVSTFLPCSVRLWGACMVLVCPCMCAWCLVPLHGVLGP